VAPVYFPFQLTLCVVALLICIESNRIGSRWILLLLGHEFELSNVLQIWDALFAGSFFFQIYFFFAFHFAFSFLPFLCLRLHFGLIYCFGCLRFRTDTSPNLSLLAFFIVAMLIAIREESEFTSTTEFAFASKFRKPEILAFLCTG
jgi:hypothetical protein